MSNNHDTHPLPPALRNGQPPAERPSNPPAAPQARQRWYLQAATSENTRRSYRSAIRHFQHWGGALPCHAQTVIDYLLAHAEQLNPRTLAVRLTALSQWHRYQGFADPTQGPTVRKTLQGIRRTHGRPRRQAQALRLEHVVAMLRYLAQQPESKKKRRDLALIQVGFFGAFRRSELVGLQVAHLHWAPEGLSITLPRSKTDPHGEGLIRALARGSAEVCPVRALKTWLAVAAIDQGPVFRPVNRWDQVQPRALHPGAVNVLLKQLGESCGFDFAPALSSHSFRRGMASCAARAQVDFELIQKQGGWRRETTVREYIEEGRRFEDNATVTLLEQMAALMKGPPAAKD